MRISLQHRLRTRTIAFASSFRSSTPDAKSVLIKQLLAYRYVFKGGGSTDAFQKLRRVLSGKHGGEGDDVCLCLQMLNL